MLNGERCCIIPALKNYRQNPLNYSVPLSNGLRAGTPGQRTSVSGQHGSLDASGFHLVPKIGGGSYGSLARGLAQGMNASARTREIRDTLMLWFNTDGVMEKWKYMRR